jgi:PAS domain S-box-containing protein
MSRMKGDLANQHAAAEATGAPVGVGAATERDCGPLADGQAHRRILIVDDNQAIHADFRKILGPRENDERLHDLEAALFGQERDAGAEHYELESALQGQEAVEMVRAALAQGRPFALAFVDMRMPPGWDGLETIERLWQIDPDLQIVICSAYSDHSRQQIVARTGRSHRLVILKKPFDNAEIAQLACAMTEKWRTSRQAGLKMSQLETEVARRTAEIAHANQQLTMQVAQLQQMKKALETSEERYALSARGANDGLWDWDLISNQVYYSARMAEIAGLREDEIGDTPEFWFSRVHPNDLPSVREAVARHLQGATAHLESEHRLRLPGGQYRWVLCRGVAVRDASGKPWRVAGSLADVTRRKETEDQLRRGAYYDKLTGLPNRALLRECMGRAMQDVHSDPQRRFAVIFLDFDRFKVINDSLGHMAGDQLLVEIAQRLTCALQEGPPQSQPHSHVRSLAAGEPAAPPAPARPGRPHTLARLGGDEFVILLEGVRSEQDAVDIAQVVHRAVEQPFAVHNQDVHVTASIGIALGCAECASPEDLLRDADTAMYHAKAAGRARHVVFDRSMRDAAVTRLRLENDLRSAIRRGEITLEYQPIFSLRSSEVIAVEALARWRHPEHGAVAPDRFVAIAEETGLIVALGQHVLRTACRDLRLLHERHGRRNLRVNVNLSSRQFAHISLVGEVQEIMRAAAIAPGSLALELTETVVMDDFEAAIATIQRLRELNVDIYLDDFGTGYSSLSCLKSLPLTGLKLDRSFVAQISAGVVNPAIIHAIVTLGGHLRLQVVAEGIETSEQLASVIALECDSAQGFMLGRPMPFDRLTEWLAKAAQRAVAA